MVEKTRSSYYYRIPGLLVPQDAVYDIIDSSIDEFIGLVPELIDRIEYNDENDRQSHLVGNIEQLVPLLDSISAKWLLTDAQLILRGIANTGEIPKTTPLDSFISDLNTLSIELQKAKSIDSSNKEALCPISVIEAHSDIIHNLSAVVKLIEDCDYDRALSIALDVHERSENDELAGLLKRIRRGNYNEAIEFANNLKEKHSDSIETLGTDMSIKVLAVDDRPEILSFVNSALESHYKVFGTGNGITALKIIDAQKPHLFILDIDMPDMDGFELAEKIRAKPLYKKSPIIFLTGNSTPDHISRAMQVGADDFIVKPSTHQALLTKVGKHFGGA